MFFVSMKTLKIHLKKKFRERLNFYEIRFPSHLEMPRKRVEVDKERLIRS